ncbi:MAG TPA: RNA polymerase sigma factor, partial [Candidatus Limnocylindria bacterium]|nr:RNA polymerase sigma factor [Candidatus Limnocylindria bacterium]
MAEDEQLPVAAARAGDAAAWDALFRRYQLPLYVYVFELVRNEQTALDVVQESFINATRYLRSLREDRKFGSWLFSIAHQKCQQHWRKPQRTQPLDDDFAELPGDEPGPDDLLVRAEQQEEFMKLLNQLPEIHCSVLLLHFLEDFSLEEIAGVIGTNVGTVKSRLHYAKKTLRALL